MCLSESTFCVCKTTKLFSVSIFTATAKEDYQLGKLGFRKCLATFRLKKYNFTLICKVVILFGTSFVIVLSNAFMLRYLIYNYNLPQSFEELYDSGCFSWYF